MKIFDDIKCIDKIKFSEPSFINNPQEDSVKLVETIMAKMVDERNEKIMNAIYEEAKENGVNEILLIDKEKFSNFMSWAVGKWVEEKNKSTEEPKKVKVYQVMIGSLWNWLVCVGFYYELDDAIEDINGYIKDDGIELKKGDLTEYPSSFNSCFDLDLEDYAEKNEIKIKDDQLEYEMVRGFIFEVSEETAKELCEG